MATEEDLLNEEIARLEAELEHARLASQLKHLQAQLEMTQNRGGDVIEEWDDEEGYDEEIVEDGYDDEEYEEIYEEGKVFRWKTFVNVGSPWQPQIKQ